MCGQLFLHGNEGSVMVMTDFADLSHLPHTTQTSSITTCQLAHVVVLSTKHQRKHPGETMSKNTVFVLDQAIEMGVAAMPTLVGLYNNSWCMF
jgi:hypothetical protein